MTAVVWDVFFRFQALKAGQYTIVKYQAFYGFILNESSESIVGMHHTPSQNIFNAKFEENLSKDAQDKEWKCLLTTFSVTILLSNHMR